MKLDVTEIEMRATKRDELLELVRRQGLVTVADVERAGYARAYLSALAREGWIERDARGLYSAIEGRTFSHSLAVLGRRAPDAIVCLLSALLYYDIGVEAPFELWISVAPRARAPKLGAIPTRVFRPSEPCRSAGVEVHEIEGVPVKITSPAKTVVDCFKYRNQIGADVGVEALREVLAERRARIGEISKYATLCRVDRVMAPYLHALVP